MRFRRNSDQQTNGTAISTEIRQSGTCERPEKTSPVSVVLIGQPGGVADHAQRRRRGGAGRAQVDGERVLRPTSASTPRPPGRSPRRACRPAPPARPGSARRPGPRPARSWPARRRAGTRPARRRGRRTPCPDATGRLSRHRAPRPSRHQALTPKSSAPPEATRPGSTVIELHGRSPSSGHQAGTDRQHGDAAPHRHRPPHRAAVGADQRGEVGARRPAGGEGAGLDAQLVARDPARGQVGGHGADDDGDHQQHRAATPTVCSQRRSNPVTIPTTSLPGGDPVEERRAGCRRAGARARHRAARRPGPRMPTTPCGTRRAPSSPRPRPARSPSRWPPTAARRPARRRADRWPEGEGRAAEQHPGLQQPGDVERRQEQRAQVVGGRADREDRRRHRGRAARGHRPTPPPTRSPSARNPASAVGSSSTTSKALPVRRRRARTPAATAAAAVTTSRTPAPQRNVQRRRTAEARKRTRWPTSATARSRGWLSPGGRGRHGALLARHLGGGHGRDAPRRRAAR